MTRLSTIMIVFVWAGTVTTETEAEQHSLFETHGLSVHGFYDLRGGVRTQGDSNQGDETLGEARLQFDVQRDFDAATLQFRSDVLYDWVLNETKVQLEEGKGWVDVREANLLFSPVNMMDVKIGRQIVTWGTGDLIFINDLFPKDFQSFFVGRDEEYLKAPSDALFVSLFLDWVNFDVVYTPRFDADRFISGQRISFFNPAVGRHTGEDTPIRVNRPNDWFSDDEIALRLSRNVNGYELAGYAYRGYWKSPRGADPVTGSATFPMLQVFGASARGQIAGGIGHLEVGYYDSLNDRNGDDPLVPNREMQVLLGYQHELARDLTTTLQYYLEYKLDYDAFTRAIPESQPIADEDRHVVTARLTQLLWNQDLTLSLFAFYSPSDEDGYVRPTVSYKATDQWLLTAGGNIFLGNRQHTFFGQFEDNSNIYAGARYSF